MFIHMQKVEEKNLSVRRIGQFIMNTPEPAVLLTNIDRIYLAWPGQKLLHTTSPAVFTNG